MDWIPISQMPEELKDGRDLLLWGHCKFGVNDDVYAPDANVGWWYPDTKCWITRRDGETITPTHYAIVTPPEGE